jgi:hypothetical protein
MEAVCPSTGTVTLFAFILISFNMFLNFLWLDVLCFEIGNRRNGNRRGGALRAKIFNSHPDDGFTNFHGLLKIPHTNLLMFFTFTTTS